VTKTQSAGPISCLEHRATRVLHCAIVTRAAVLMFSLLLWSIISNQMRPRRLRVAWFSRLLRHPARRRSGSILSPGTHTGLLYDNSFLAVDQIEVWAVRRPLIWSNGGDVCSRTHIHCSAACQVCRVLLTFSCVYKNQSAVLKNV